LNFKEACRKCVGKLLYRPICYLRNLKRKDLFVIGNVDVEHIPLLYRFTLDRHVALAVNDMFWAVDVKGLMVAAFPTDVEQAIKELNCIVLEEICHYLGWDHSPGKMLHEMKFMREISENDC